MKSKSVSIENIKQFFANTSEDIITLEEAYIAWGRDTTKEFENKAWLSNKLTALKYHNLVKPVYALRNKKRVLDKIQLTMEGKKALGRIGEDVIMPESIPTNGKTVITLEDVIKVISRLRRENPEINIVFSITPKE